MIVSRLAYLMGVQISTSYAAAFSFPGDLLPEFPLKLKRAPAICADMQCYASCKCCSCYGCRFQSAICADMQCYKRAAQLLSDTESFQSAICADMQCYTVLLHRRGVRGTFQSAICADMQCYSFGGFPCRNSRPVSVRYLRGYAVLLVLSATAALMADGFSPLSARICSATATTALGIALEDAFQSAICADMQCYTYPVVEDHQTE